MHMVHLHLILSHSAFQNHLKYFASHLTQALDQVHTINTDHEHNYSSQTTASLGGLPCMSALYMYAYAQIWYGIVRIRPNMHGYGLNHELAQVCLHPLVTLLGRCQN